MEWMMGTITVCAVALVFLVDAVRVKLHRMVAAQEEATAQLRTVSNASVMLFYAVEQIYEMSPLFSRFETSRAGAERGFFDPHPVVNVKDKQSSDAWNALMDRMNERMETVFARQHHTASGEFRDPDLTNDPDLYRITKNQEDWIARLPMLHRWPPHGTIVAAMSPLPNARSQAVRE